MLAEHESTKALQLLRALCEHHGLKCAQDSDIDQLVSATSPAEIIRELKQALDVRLAIECDGDEFHGPDRWLHDMNRQRILERAGWTFWRCFASTWKLRKEEVFQELLKRLTVMEIEPTGSLEQSSKLVERRTVTVGSPLTTESKG